MTDYDFKALNDKEFEVLVTDLLSRRDNKTYERFKPGRDAGVDGRFFASDGSETIVQCKHWPSSPIEKLIKHLADVEFPKIERLNPSRYIVAVSHPLSRNDKSQIMKALHPYVKAPLDIMGREDLNDLLALHQQVEQRHYKLWIASTTALQAILNKPILDRSADALQQAQRAAHLYVPTANHDRALEKLERLGTVIITGAAGIGKTTLAENLALHYVSKGFNFVYVADEIREAEAVYQSNDLQLFYFDDFLGRNYLQALSGHEGAHIVNFIRRVAHDRKKRFILTSRTTILNHGKVLMDTFQNSNIERNEFEVSFESFSEIDKARILYNHIWHSSLAEQYIDELYRDRRYRSIISHRNYNPRLIRFITDSERLESCPPSRYWQHAQDLLANPARVWENPFEAQHDDFGRALILLVTLNGKAIAQDQLAEAYARLLAHPDAKAMNGRRDFLQSLRHLSGSMLSRVMVSATQPYLNLFNPSIGDYVLHRYASDLPSLRAGFASLRSRSSLDTLNDLVKNDLVSREAERSILSSILNDALAVDFLGYQPEYIATALCLWAGAADLLDFNDPLVLSCTTFLASSECPHSFEDAARVLHAAHRANSVSDTVVLQFAASACSQVGSVDELKALASLINSLPESISDDVMEALETAAVEYFSDAVHDEFSDDDVFRTLEPDDKYEAERRLTHLVEARLDELGLPISDSAVEAIVEAFDVNERIREYFQPEPDYDYREGRTFSGTGSDAIDDLFDRTR